MHCARFLNFRLRVVYVKLFLQQELFQQIRATKPHLRNGADIINTALVTLNIDLTFKNRILWFIDRRSPPCYSVTPRSRLSALSSLLTVNLSAKCRQVLTQLDLCVCVCSLLPKPPTLPAAEHFLSQMSHNATIATLKSIYDHRKRCKILKTTRNCAQMLLVTHEDVNKVQ